MKTYFSPAKSATKLTISESLNDKGQLIKRVPQFDCCKLIRYGLCIRKRSAVNNIRSKTMLKIFDQDQRVKSFIYFILSHQIGQICDYLGLLNTCPNSIIDNQKLISIFEIRYRFLLKLNANDQIKRTSYFKMTFILPDLSIDPLPSRMERALYKL